MGHGTADGLLINGKGVYYQYKNINATEPPRAIFNVTYGYKYRFRLIHAGVLNCPIIFSIDNHNLTIIASDGYATEPFEISSLTIMAGKI